MPSVKRIDLSEELVRIAGEMDDAGRRGREYTVSKYDSDLLRDAASAMAARRAPAPADAERAGGGWDHAKDLLFFLAAHEGRYAVIIGGNTVQFVFDDSGASRTFHAIFGEARSIAERAGGG